MRRVSALVAALSLAATGCSFSTVDPSQSVRVSGHALDASGRPLVDARVLLVKQADIGEVVFGSILTIGSLSTTCLLPDAPAICRKARTTTTDSEGRYEFDLKGADTQGTLGTESTLNVVFSGGRSSTTVSFAAKDAAVSLPDARLWNARAKASQGSGGIRLTWSPVPSDAGRATTYSAQLFEARGQAPLWTQNASGTSATVDPRILEDRPGAVAAGATAELAGGSGSGTVRASYQSNRVAVRPTAGTPPSRGHRCAPVTGTAPVRNGVFTRCGATDGDLDSPARLHSKAGTVTGVLVDLGRPRRISLVVARGFAGQLLVETSTDGRTFQTVATSSGSAVALAVPGSPTVRFVRLRSPSGLDESLGTEISVW